MDLDSDEPTYNQCSMNILPNEILLKIFRKLSAIEFVTCLPCVCKRWSKLIASDTYTLKLISMHHVNMYDTVSFFFIEKDCEDYIFNELAVKHKLIWRSWLDPDSEKLVDYSNAFYLCTKYSEVYQHIKTLVITFGLTIYQTEGFTYLNNLTTLVFCSVGIQVEDQHTLIELGTVYSNIRNIMYINCTLSVHFEKRYLHMGFKHLKRFRLDHHSANYKLLDELLTMHNTLETIILGDCTMNDRWIEVLMYKLQGRIVKSVFLQSPYFTYNCIAQFLATTNFYHDTSNIVCNCAFSGPPFSITMI